MKSVSLSMLALMLSMPVMADEAPATAAPEVAAAPDAAPASDQAPIIFCEESTFDFGTLPSTQAATHEYVIVNKGNATLEITQARPSCGCTVANISQKTVAPGEETRITASLNLAGRSGAQHKTITVESNDPKQPQLTLTLQGNIGDAVNVQPNQVILGQISAETKTTSEVVISSGDGQTFKVLTAEPSTPFLTATISTKEEGKSYGLLIETKMPMEPGPMTGSIHVKTDSPSKPEFDIPVSAIVAGQLIVAPQDITLVEQPDQSVTRYVIVRSGNNTAFEVMNVEPPDPSITVQISPFGGNGYRIQLDNIKPTHALDGKILKLTTSVESMKEISVPFHVIAGS